MPDLSPSLVTAALGGDRQAARQLVDELGPVIRARVGRALVRKRRQAGSRDLSQEVADMTQEVFAALLAEQGWALKAWDPARGMSLVNFVGLLAEREVASILRSGRRSPWTEDPTLAEELEQGEATEAPADEVLSSRELLTALLERLKASLSPQGMRLFELLFVEERSVEEVCEAASMNRDAVYAWRSRLGKHVRGLTDELLAERRAKVRA